MSRKLTLIFGLLMLIAVAACQPAQPTATPQPSPTLPPSLTPAPTITPTRIPEILGVDPSAAGQVRFMVAVPDAPAVDIYVESALVVRQLAPGRVTPTTSLAPDRYLLRAVLAGQPSGTETPLISEVFDLEMKESVIFILTGSAQAFKLNRYPEDLSSVPVGQVRVTLINVLPQDIAVGATLDGEATGSTQSGGLPTEPRLFKSGRRSAIFQSAGTEIFRETVTLQDRNAHTLILYAGTDGKPKLVVVSSPTRREVRVRVVNGARELETAYDVYLDNQRIADDLAVGGATDWQGLRAQPYTLRILPSDAEPDARPLYETRISLNADQAGTFVIYATLSEEVSTVPVALFALEDLSPVEPERARLTVVNAIRQRAPISVNSQSQPLGGFPVVDFGNASPSVALSVGPLQLVFTTSGENQPRTVESVAAFNLEAGQSYLYIVTGTGSTGEPLAHASEIGLVAAAQLTPTPSALVTIRLINALPTIDSVDLAQGGAVIFSGVRSGTSSTRRAVDLSIRELTLTRAGSPDVISRADLQFITNGELTIVALDVPGKPGEVQLLQTLERNRPNATTAVLRFIHASTGSPAVSISSPRTIQQPVNPLAKGPTPTPIRSETLYVSLLKFGEISRVITLRQGEYVFEARNAVDGNPLTDTQVQIAPGQRYDVLVWPGDDTGRPSFLLVAAGE